MKRTSIITLAILSLAYSAIAQSGGGFEITEAVVAGGGSSSSSGDVGIDATLGQPIAGGAVGSGDFSITSGFWNFAALAPTAAQASISGRVLNASGTGVSNAALYVQTQDGELLIARSSSLGYYLFEGIEIGQTVFMTVEHKRFTFQPRTVTVADNVTDLDFIAQ